MTPISIIAKKTRGRTVTGHASRKLTRMTSAKVAPEMTLVR